MKQFIDKLIGRLEEESDYEPIDYDCCDISCTDEQHFIATDKAIEIVNQLAEEHKDDIQTIDVSELLGEQEQVNDFCEWKFTKSVADGGYFYSSGCNHKRFSDLHSFEFCPYCGKKIKVAPYQTKGE